MEIGLAVDLGLELHRAAMTHRLRDLVSCECAAIGPNVASRRSAKDSNDRPRKSTGGQFKEGCSESNIRRQ